MAVRMVHLPRPIALDPSAPLSQEPDRAPADVLREVDKLAAQGILPATLEHAEDGGWRMALYTERHVVWLLPSEAQDAFLVGDITRRRFLDEERLTNGALLLRATFHQLSVRDGLPAEELWREWESLPAEGGTDAESHDIDLDLLELATQAARQIESVRSRTSAPQRYVSRAHSGGGVYSFQLTRPGMLAPDTIVCPGEAAELRGRVIRAYGRMVTVQFPRDTDPQRLRGQGTLLAVPSDRVHLAQLEAVARLRRGEARNPGLLSILTERSYAPYEPASDVSPSRPLDPEQLDAFRRALSVPDVLSVLGPPGTGKTTTIVEVIKAQVQAGQRVLFTAPSHRAVDDVLEHLPPDFGVVRIGAEDAMSAQVRAFTAQSRAEAVRQAVLTDTSTLDKLAELGQARQKLEAHLGNLHAQLQVVHAAQDELVRTEAAIDDAIKRADAALRAQLAQAERESVRQQSILATTEAGLTQSYHSAIDSQSRADGGSPLAFAYRWHANQQRRRSERLAQILPTAKAASERALALRAKLRDEFDTLVANDPSVAGLRAARDRAQQALAGAWPEVRRSGQVAAEMLGRAGAAPASPPDTAEGWSAFHTACVAALSTLDRRGELLAEWRATMGDATHDLAPELARHTHVVAATGLGSETSAHLAELDFDLAIVDGADQATLPNLLVPLVCARRAVLVGDHTLPPPLPEEEVRAWVGGLTLAEGEAERVTGLLAASGFEQFFTRAPEPNAVSLRTQRRMPAQIAGYASTFYNDSLRSEHRGGLPDPLFASPFAMVNTADRPSPDELETGLIAQLAAHGQRHYRDWAVVVSTPAAREQVMAQLQETSARAADKVSCATEFRTDDRDFIVVALPLEPRQLHAAVTRARRQLVLVGDAETGQAPELLDYLAKHGDLRDSLEVEQALKSGAEPQS